MKGKILICRCEDVTVDDVEHAMARGYFDIEEVKRYTGFGTGPCQGKECLGLVASFLADRRGVAPAEIRPFTSRPPLAPTPLKFFARAASSSGSGSGSDSGSGGETETSDSGSRGE